MPYNKDKLKTILAIDDTPDNLVLISEILKIDTELKHLKSQKKQKRWQRITSTKIQFLA